MGLLSEGLMEPEAIIEAYIKQHASELATLQGWLSIGTFLRRVASEYFTPKKPAEPRVNRPLNARQQQASRSIYEVSAEEQRIAERIVKNSAKIATHLWGIVQIASKKQATEIDGAISNALNTMWPIIIGRQNSSLDKVKSYLQLLLSEADNGDKGDDKKTTSGPSKDRDTGEILYHLDMATRHLDVLVDYTLVMGHEEEIVSISSSVQELAQRLRSELEAARVPLDEREPEGGEPPAGPG
jgi:hypothetical protein